VFRLLPLLHVLLLLGVFLLHLLRLLLVPLLHLLPLLLAGVLTLHLLMLLLLLLLKVLPLLLLAGEHFVLLLLVFVVAVGVAGVGRSRSFKLGQVIGMNKRTGAPLTTSWSLATFGGRMVRRSSFP